MSFKGTAGKSASGASISKYDVEVEARLQALEKGLADCKAACAANSHSHSGGDVTGLAAGAKAVVASGDGPEAKVDALLNLLADQ